MEITGLQPGNENISFISSSGASEGISRNIIVDLPTLTLDLIRPSIKDTSVDDSNDSFTKFSSCVRDSSFANFYTNYLT
jgi:hypothetical protein